MKVLLVATVQSHICQFHKPLVAMLHEQGCEVDVAARNNLAEKNGLKLDFVEKVFDVPFQRSPFSPKNLGAYKQLKKLIDEGNYDVIHCNTPVGGVLGRLAAKQARKKGTKVFYTAHGFHFYKGAPKKNWLIWYPVEKHMARRTDTLITITQEDYELSSAKFPTHTARIHGVGANSAKYTIMSDAEKAAIRQELGYRDNEIILLCTGELLPNKNQKTIIQAMPAILKEAPYTCLLLAGNGPEKNNLQAQIDSLNLNDNVQLIGYRIDLERYANIADIIVSCSFREGLPMNIVEGMLLKKPVVASLNRGHRELIVPDVTGYMVPPDNSGEFAQKILELIHNPLLAKAMGEAGFEKGFLYSDISVRKELIRIYFSEI